MKLTRNQLRKLIEGISVGDADGTVSSPIMEQLNTDQLQKLSNYLYSDNEADVRQGMSLVQSFIDEDNSYPGVKDLYYRVAADRDADISQLKTEISHLEQQHAEVGRRLQSITRQIKKHKDYKI